MADSNYSSYKRFLPATSEDSRWASTEEIKSQPGALHIRLDSETKPDASGIPLISPAQL